VAQPPSAVISEDHSRGRLRHMPLFTHPCYYPNMETSPELDAFETLSRNRRAVRNFLPDPVPLELLDRLLDVARWAPSGYNLQPTHFVVVTDPQIRAQLRPACLNQRQVTDAPVIIVLAGDGNVMQNNFESCLAADRNLGAINEDYEKVLRSIVPLAFERGPMGLGWLWKSTLMPVAKLFRPIPDLPAVNQRFWATKQVMLVAMNLMLAASAAGLATLPMEGFDESRVKRVLKIPRTQVVPVIIAMGYPTPGQTLAKSRLPLEKFVHRDKW
jgi:nitroreductase